MIRYRIVADVYPVKGQNGTPEYSHLFVAEVDEKEFYRAQLVRRTSPLTNDDEVLKQEIEDMAAELLTSRDLTPSGKVVSLKTTPDATHFREGIPNRFPDLLSSGIYLWYCGEGTFAD